METEDASKVAKETVYGNKSGSVHKVQHFKKQVDEHSVLNSKLKSKGQKKRDFAKGVCPRCGNIEHIAKDCPHIKSTCHFCQKMGHLQSVCLKKKKEDRGSVKIISRHALRTVKSINSIPQLKQSVWVSGQQLTFEVDTGAGQVIISALRIYGRNLEYLHSYKCPVAIKWLMGSVSQYLAPSELQLLF